VIGNIDAMILAVENAASGERFDQREILAIHDKLLEHAVNRHVAGRFREEQNWIGGNDYNPCGADFVPPPIAVVAANRDRCHFNDVGPGFALVRDDI
jgi:Fic family protein